MTYTKSQRQSKVLLEAIVQMDKMVKELDELKKVIDGVRRELWRQRTKAKSELIVELSGKNET